MLRSNMSISAFDKYTLGQIGIKQLVWDFGYTQNKYTINKIEYEKDVYWKQFLAHKKVLQNYGYITDNSPTSKGEIIARLRAENELFISEIILLP